MLESLINQVSSALAACQDLNELQNIRSQFLGKTSEINNQMKKLGELPAEERKEAGQKINVVRDQIQNLIEMRKQELEEALQNAKLVQEKLDLTLPARNYRMGSIHPITQCMEELTQVFSKYGFTVMDGPDIEDDWYNFTALNIAENHPARQMHDTFYLKSENNNKVLRTHTSPIQIRTMQNGKPPFRFIAPGRTYRSDSDMTHTPMFHQIEGLVVDKGINMGHLKYIIIDFIRNFFENANIEVQFRPSFFPFTEPSAEVDIRMDKNDRWLEVLGCGMIHPNVLRNVDIDPNEYQGFAFGMGVERFAMLKYGIKDLRKFFEGDKRWLNHYNFKNFDIPTLAGGLTR